MDEDLEIDLLLNRKNYGIVYKINFLLIIISCIFIYIIFIYKFQSYSLFKAKMINNYLEIIVNIEDINYIINNNILIIDNKEYSYTIDHMSDLYIDNNYHNYIYIYLNVDNLYNVDNYIYDIKIIKENKILAEYLKDYL